MVNITRLLAESFAMATPNYGRTTGIVQCSWMVLCIDCVYEGEILFPFLRVLAIAFGVDVFYQPVVRACAKQNIPFSRRRVELPGCEPPPSEKIDFVTPDLLRAVLSVEPHDGKLHTYDMTVLKSRLEPGRPVSTEGSG